MQLGLKMLTTRGNVVNTDTRLASERSITSVLLEECSNSAISEFGESLKSSTGIVSAVGRSINSCTVNLWASTSLKSCSCAVNSVSPGGKEFSVEVTALVNIRGSDKRGSDHSSERVDTNKGRHELVTQNSALLIDNSHTFNIEVTSSENTHGPVIIPSTVRDLVRDFDIDTVFPLDESIGILEDSSAQVRSFGVLLESAFSVTISKWLIRSRGVSCCSWANLSKSDGKEDDFLPSESSCAQCSTHNRHYC